MSPTIRNSAIRVAGIYAAVSFMWIAFSDKLAMAMSADLASLAWFQTAKGLFFVSATSVILYIFSKRQFKRLVAEHSERELDAVNALREKETLLREINHRVKNNLQVIVSLLNLHENGDNRYTELGQKVRSMALAHELLTSSPDMSSIEAGHYAERLAESLSTSTDLKAVSIRGSGDSTMLSADTVVAIGVLIAEACSNASRHARRPDDRPVSVSVSIRTQDGAVVVEVRDDGQGFADRAPGILPIRSDSLGLVLMDAIATQVRGTLSRRNDGGAVVELRIPAGSQPASG